jgi:hypothetical protein
VNECPKTRFPDGTHCGEYGWHARDCPDRESCTYCGEQVVFDHPVKGEWAHTSGNRYCRDRRGFTATPLQVATPTYHGGSDVL